MSSVCMPGKSWRKARGLTTAPERRCAPGALPFSTTAIGTSPRRSRMSGRSSRSWARRIAAESPAGPAPTTRAPTSIRSSGGSEGSVMNSSGSKGGGKSAAGLSSPSLRFHELGQLGDDLMHVSDDAEVGVFEDRRIRSLVDGDERARALHADLVLDRPGDPAGDVELRRDGLACLADLARVRVPAGIHDRPGGGYRAAESLGQTLYEREVLGFPEPPPARHDHLGILDRRTLALLVSTLEHDRLLRPVLHLDRHLRDGRAGARET